VRRHAARQQCALLAAVLGVRLLILMCIRRLCRNYVKFLCDRSGRPVKRYGPAFDPLEFEGDVRLVLAGKSPTPEECYMHPGRSVCNVDRILGQ
jgi:hypothetical protein